MSHNTKIMQKMQAFQIDLILRTTQHVHKETGLQTIMQFLSKDGLAK